MTQLEEAKRVYEQIITPEELNEMVELALIRGQNKSKWSGKGSFKGVKSVACFMGVVLSVGFIAINTSQTTAAALDSLPVIGTVVNALNIRKEIYPTQEQISEEHSETELLLKSVKIQDSMEVQNGIELFGSNLSNVSLPESAENSRLLESYDLEVQNVQLVQSDITLEDLLGADYINIANRQIKAEMKERMRLDENITYWAPEMNGFTTITENTKFYINEAGNPVIVFDKFEVAPGYMGSEEFEIVPE